MTYVELDPDEHRDVTVRLDDGLWVPGTLESFRKVEGVWSGQVRYALGDGTTSLDWFEDGRIRGANFD